MKFIKNKIWAFILARQGSKKIKNKNLLKIKGLPLIAYSLSTALSHRMIDEVYFSSDSKKYLKIAKKFGCKNLLLRNKKLAKDKSSDLDVFKDFIAKMIKKKNIYQSL